jgi:hypothetical protein
MRSSRMVTSWGLNSIVDELSPSNDGLYSATNGMLLRALGSGLEEIQLDPPHLLNNMLKRWSEGLGTRRK